MVGLAGAFYPEKQGRRDKVWKVPQNGLYRTRKAAEKASKYAKRLLPHRKGSLAAIAAESRSLETEEYRPSAGQDTAAANGVAEVEDDLSIEHAASGQHQRETAHHVEQQSQFNSRTNGEALSQLINSHKQQCSHSSMRVCQCHWKTFCVDF